MNILQKLIMKERIGSLLEGKYQGGSNRLCYATTTYTQPVTVGIDDGGKLMALPSIEQMNQLGEENFIRGVLTMMFATAKILKESDCEPSVLTKIYSIFLKYGFSITNPRSSTAGFQCFGTQWGKVYDNLFKELSLNEETCGWIEGRTSPVKDGGDEDGRD